jgi:hypothetical protein
VEPLLMKKTYAPAEAGTRVMSLGLDNARSEGLSTRVTL